MKKKKPKFEERRDGIFKRTENAVYYAWYPWRYAIGRPARVSLKTRDLTGVGAHTLRHTYISMLCQAGVPITVIKELAGHADIQTTMRYVHLSPHHRRSAVEKLSLK